MQWLWMLQNWSGRASCYEVEPDPKERPRLTSMLSTVEARVSCDQVVSESADQFNPHARIPFD